MEDHPGPVVTKKSTSRAKIEIISSSDLKLTAKFTNTDRSVVTLLRRIIYSEVPTMAFDVISIDTNTSNLSDEIIVSRLSFVPLRILDPSILNCECTSGEVCENCNVTFYLNATCSSGSCMILANQLRTAIGVTKTLGIDKRDLKTPLVPLKVGQTIRLTAIARKGTGSIHAKWTPVASIAFYDPTLEGVPIDDIPADFIPSETTFMFYLESVGQLPAIDIFRMGIERLLQTIHITWDQFITV